MEAAASSIPVAVAPKYGGFTIVLIICIIIAIIIAEIISAVLFSRDWASIRCVPYIMPFAGLFGHDVNENFQFCMSESFKKQAGESIAPIYKFFGGFIGVLSTLVDSANSIRLSFATFMGGFVTMVSEFNDRFRLFMSQVQLSAQRFKMLMYRIYATFYAMIYMALSSIRAVNNFGDTALFGFLDTFCFDPDTPVEIENRGIIPIREVVLGDIFAKTRSRVTSTFRFMADGQPMVMLGDIYVSTNHYVLYEERWIRAEEHPSARSAAPWSGGSERPLICFNTDNNMIPIGDYIFRDYDETTAGIEDAIKWTDSALNAGMGALRGVKREWKECIPAMERSTEVKCSSGIKPVTAVQLGDTMKPTRDRVTGIIDTYVTEYVETADGKLTPGTLIWHEPTGTWERIGTIYPHKVIRVDASKPLIFRSFIVLSGSRIELKSGMIIRDYMEVASPWAEDPYSSALKKLGLNLGHFDR
jgi:hypothetical protein